MKFQHTIRGIGILVALGCYVSVTRAAEPPVFTPAQLRADLDALGAAIRDMPPDLSHSTDPKTVAAALRELDRQIGPRSLDRDSVWRLFATLNPLLADGHLLVGFVDWRGDSRAHLAAGGVFFPYELTVSPRGELRVESALGGGASDLRGAEVTSVNGVDARQVTAALLARMNGDTPAFRAALLSRRFWFNYWKVFGAPASFDMAFAGQKEVRRMAGSSALPAVLADEASFDRQFRMEILPGNTALLTVSSFAWPDKAQFLAFTQRAFEELRTSGARTLIIDVRANGGGDDVMWIEGILPYLATRPYRWASHFRKRVVVADEAKHEAVGAIVDGEVETWIPPQPDNPLRFPGKVYVLVGSATYSSAVVFSNVMQDFGFGTVAGLGESVRTAQSGGVRRTTLPNCGLIFAAPRFILTRPSGAAEPVLLTPDLPVRDLSQLLEIIGTRTVRAP